jgi:hypothetical protein
MKRSSFGGLRVKFCPTNVILVIMRFQAFFLRLPDLITWRVEEGRKSEGGIQGHAVQGSFGFFPRENGIEEGWPATEKIWRVWGAKKKGVKMKIGGRRKCERLAF